MYGPTGAAAAEAAAGGPSPTYGPRISVLLQDEPCSECGTEGLWRRWGGGDGTPLSGLL